MSEWKELLSADILTLGMAADEARRSARATNVVTYVRVHEVPLGGAGQAPDGAAELRTYALPDTLDAAVAHVRAMKATAGERRVTAYSWADLQARGWTSARELVALRDAGLDDLAELPADLVDDVDAALRALSAAGLHVQRVTIAQPIGDAKEEIIRRVQRTFAAHSALRRFSPLPRVAPVDRPTTGYDDVRMVALARLALRERSVEVDWTLYGPKLAQVALTFGADHLDAVSAADADPELGRRRGAVEDVERNIRAAGFEPQEYRFER